MSPGKCQLQQKFLCSLLAAPKWSSNVPLESVKQGHSTIAASFYVRLLQVCMRMRWLLQHFNQTRVSLRTFTVTHPRIANSQHRSPSLLLIPGYSVACIIHAAASQASEAMMKTTATNRPAPTCKHTRSAKSAGRQYRIPSI